MTQTRSTTGYQEGYKDRSRRTYCEICILSPPNQGREGFLAEKPKQSTPPTKKPKLTVYATGPTFDKRMPKTLHTHLQIEIDK